MSHSPDRHWSSLICFQLRSKDHFSPQPPHTVQVQVQVQAKAQPRTQPRATYASSQKLRKTQSPQLNSIACFLARFFQRSTLTSPTTPIHDSHDGQIDTPTHRPALPIALTEHPPSTTLAITPRQTHDSSLHVHVLPPTPQLPPPTPCSEPQSVSRIALESHNPQTVHDKRQTKLHLHLRDALLIYKDFYANISNILDWIDTPVACDTQQHLTKLTMILSTMAHEVRILAQFVLDGTIPRLSSFWSRAWIFFLELDILSESIRDVIDQLTTDGRPPHQHQQRLQPFHPNHLLVGSQLFLLERKVQALKPRCASSLARLRSLNVFAMDQRQTPFPSASSSRPSRVYEWIRGLGAQDFGDL